MISLSLVDRPPARPRSASFSASWPRPETLTEPSREPIDSIEPLPEWLEPIAWKPKRRGRLRRLVAQMLVQLLVVNALPPELQVASFALAISPFWSPLEDQKPALSGPRRGSPKASPATSPDPATRTAGGVSEARLRCDQCRRSDILLIGNTAVVSGATGTRIDGLSGGAALVDFTDALSPEVVGYVAGIASRMAVDSFGGILYSSHRSFVTGTRTALAGVKTATLGYLTVIAEVKENPVLLAADRKTIERQVVKYRAIFPRNDIETSELEILRNGTPSQWLDAPLDDFARGELTIPEGLDHPVGITVTTRLVINRSRPESERPRAVAKRLGAEAFEIQPVGPESAAIADEPLQVVASNPALLDRLERDPDTPLPSLEWSGPGVIRPSPPEPTGIYSTEVSVFGSAGVREEARLLQGFRLMARTGPITVIPGPPFSGTLTAGPPTHSQGIEPGLVPADGASEVVITLKEVRDAEVLGGPGNLVEDGTPVAWSIVEGDGQLLDTENSVTTGGRAIVRYRAGTDEAPTRIRAAIPHPGFGEKTWDVVVTQVRLRVTVEDLWPQIEVTVDSEGAGLPSNDTVVGWIAGRGRIVGQEKLTSGRALAVWTDWSDAERRPGQWRGRFIPVGATVGRARNGFMYDTQRSFSGLPVRSGLELRLGADRIAPRFDGSPYPTTTAVEVAGGEPGATVRLVVGSSRFPEVEPIAAYSFDSLTNHIAADVYGRYAGSVSDTIALDTSDESHAPATYLFDGAGHVDIPHAPAFALATDFGFNGWVYFDSLTPGQRVLEKAGAYGVELIEDAGVARLEFYVLSDGARRHVVSHDPVVAGTWLQFAAHLRFGVLTLGLGDTSFVALGDSAGLVDPSTSPLVIGSGLLGRLDEMAIYDFRQQPFVAFAGGAVEKEVTLDFEGRASVDLEALDGFARLAVAPPLGSPEHGFVERLRVPPVRIYEAPRDGQQDQDFMTALKAETERSVENCAEGIATGEGEFWSQQTACDVSVGLLPGTTTPQAARDLAVSGRHLVGGNSSAGVFVKVAFSLVILAASILPGGGPIGRILSKARNAVLGTKAEVLLAREALEKIEVLAKTGIVLDESGVARVLAAESGDVAAQDALRFLLGACDSSPCLSLAEDAIRSFESVGVRFGHEALAKSLVRLARDPRFGMGVVERMVRALDSAPSLAKLTDDALEGLAVFISHTKSPRRLWSVWDEMTGAAFHKLPAPQAQEAAERLFRMLKQGEVRFAETAWWHNFVARGAGTSRKRTSTRGFFHSLEGILKEAPSKIRMVDGASPGFAGRPDLLVEGTTGLIQKEFKAVGAGNLLRDGDLAQLVANIKAAKVRASLGRRLDVEALARELDGLIYVFRGPIREDLKKQVLEQAQKILRGRELRPLAQRIHDNIRFENNLPF